MLCGQTFQFGLHLTPKPDYELTSYEPVSITIQEVSIDERQVDEQINQVAERYAEFVADDPHPVRKGDSCLLAMESYENGEKLPGLTTDARTYSAGAGLMPDGFDENIIGMDVGETKTFTFEGPGIDGEGNEIVETIECTVTVKEIQKKVAPVIDDAWVAKFMPMYKDVAAMRDDIRRDLSYMTYAPILFISAATGQRVPRLFEMINYVHNQSCMRISTGMLNNILADAQTRVQPPTDRGRRLKIYYMTQVGVCPPHFVVFCNERKLFHFSYQRYLENCIRNVFGLEGTPVIMSIREKGDKEE